MRKEFKAIIACGITALMAVAGMARTIHAGDISQWANSSWLVFSWYGINTQATGCQPDDPTGDYCFIPNGVVPADQAPWEFVVGPGGATVTIVDSFTTGDHYELFDYGVSIGETTSDYDGLIFCGMDPEACMQYSETSVGFFALAPGPHSLTVQATESMMLSGVAFLRIDGDVQGYVNEPTLPVDSDDDGLTDDIDLCPYSDLVETIVVGTCDSGITNELFVTGCTISDLLSEGGNGVMNHGEYVSSSSHLLKDLVDEGLLSPKDKGKIVSCVARDKDKGKDKKKK